MLNTRKTNPPVKQAAKVKVIFLSFETLQRPQNVDIFIPAWSQSLQTWQREVATHTKPAPNQSKWEKLKIALIWVVCSKSARAKSNESERKKTTAPPPKLDQLKKQDPTNNKEEENN